MVYLSRIYTKTGDQGETGLGDGSRVPKDHPRVAAYGGVDELNAVLGLLHGRIIPDAPEADLLRSIQNDLFDVGADLCVPQPADEAGRGAAAHPAGTGGRLEPAIDRLNADLSPLTSFVFPGGQPAAAWCHLARTVCRRAERDVVTLAHAEPVNPQVIVYLNRLSDLLFVLARVYNNQGPRRRALATGQDATGQSSRSNREWLNRCTPTADSETIMFTLSAFADEISPDPQEQIDVLRGAASGTSSCAPSYKTNVLDLTDLQVRSSSRCSTGTASGSAPSARPSARSRSTSRSSRT